MCSALYTFLDNTKRCFVSYSHYDFSSCESNFETNGRLWIITKAALSKHYIYVDRCNAAFIEITDPAIN